MTMFSWFKLKGFLVLAVLIYVSFIVGDWIVDMLGLGDYGIFGTLLALTVPVIIVYWAWKTWLKQHIK